MTQMGTVSRSGCDEMGIISGRQWLQTNVSTAVCTPDENLLHQSSLGGLLLVTVTAPGLKCIPCITGGGWIN